MILILARIETLKQQGPEPSSTTGCSQPLGFSRPVLDHFGLSLSGDESISPLDCELLEEQGRAGSTLLFISLCLKIIIIFTFWLPRSMWELSSLTRDQTLVPLPAVDAWRLNHWTARETSGFPLLPSAGPDPG